MICQLLFHHNKRVHWFLITVAAPQLCVTGDERCIISCSSDGTVVVWRVTSLTALPAALKERITGLPGPAEEMLVTRQHLQVHSWSLVDSWSTTGAQLANCSHTTGHRRVQGWWTAAKKLTLKKYCCWISMIFSFDHKASLRIPAILDWVVFYFGITLPYWFLIVLYVI